MSKKLNVITLHKMISHPKKYGVDMSVLTREGRKRFKALCFYFFKSHKGNKKNKHGMNKSLTCKHFWIDRKTLNNWLKRFDINDLSKLNNMSTRPHKVKDVCYTDKFVHRIKIMRECFPTLSAKKIFHIFKKRCPDSELHSISTIARIIKKFEFDFREKIKYEKKQKQVSHIEKVIKPKDLHETKGHELIEFDMKHVCLFNRKLYAFVAISPALKHAIVHVASSPTSENALVGIKKAIAFFGDNICILNDNGSENLGVTKKYLEEYSIEQYFARKHTPKDKPNVERVIRSLQEECLNQNYYLNTIEECTMQVNRWVNFYNTVRPHNGINNLTPSEYCDTFNITVPKVETLGNMY